MIQNDYTTLIKQRIVDHFTYISYLSKVGMNIIAQTLGIRSGNGRVWVWSRNMYSEIMINLNTTYLING